MDHDPLCPRDSHSEFCEGCTPLCGTCQCVLIANVRSDERRRYTSRIEKESQRIDRITLKIEDWLEEIRARRAAREASL